MAEQRTTGRITNRFLTSTIIFTISAFFAIAAPMWAVKAAAADDIIVSAAASLTQALTAVTKAFEAEQDSVKVTLNFAASGALLQQMESGAPVDVFLSANQSFMNKAAEKNLIRVATRKDFVKNNLVLAVPNEAAGKITTLADVTKKEIERVSIGHPDSVPAGRYAKQALIAANIWDAIQEKLIYGNSVRQVLDYLMRGEVDAGLVYSTDAKLAEEKVTVVEKVATSDPIVYCLAVTASTAKEKTAQSFVDFVLSSKGQDVLAGFGFQKIGE